MSRSIKFRNALLCEHVIMGANRKPTLIGVYAGDILVREFPAQIWVGCYIEVIVDQALANRHIELEVKVDRKVVATLGLEAPKDAEGRMVALPVPSALMRIAKPGDVSFTLKADGYRPTKAVSAHFDLGSPEDFD